MYSQCPQCQAIFSVSEAHLAAHHGLVRCGRCKAVFHAVTNEVASPPGAVGASPAPTEDQDAAERQPAESPDHGAPTSPPAPDHVEQRPPKAADHPERRPPSGETGPDEYPDSFEPVRREPLEEQAEDDTGDETAAPQPIGPDELPGAITEEILIEAPPTVRDVFEEPAESESTSAAPSDEDAAGPAEPGTSASSGRGEAGSSGAPTRTGAAASAVDRRAPLQSPYRARDVRMVELPQPRPFKTATMSLLLVLLILLAFWQVKTFYLDELSQVPVLRPYLERLCRPLSCVLPPRRDFARIDMLGTSIDVNPEVPGALQITVTLINRAHFPQPYPPLRVTLSDSDGRIVGRRTYTPPEYLADSSPELLPIRDRREVAIDLAQPAQNAVGYEVELVPPVDP